MKHRRQARAAFRGLTYDGAMMMLIGTTTSQVEMTLDGTLEPAGPLPGPDFVIPAEVGRQVGGNLFHSFGVFNIHTGESAIFTGPDSVQSILSRVTVRTSSTIDSLLRSTIPNADVFLMNPAGIMFGSHAQLDISAGDVTRWAWHEGTVRRTPGEEIAN